MISNRCNRNYFSFYDKRQSIPWEIQARGHLIQLFYKHKLTAPVRKAQLNELKDRPGK